MGYGGLGLGMGWSFGIWGAGGGLGGLVVGMGWSMGGLGGAEHGGAWRVKGERGRNGCESGYGVG